MTGDQRNSREMAPGNNNLIAATVGVFGIVGLLFLFLVKRSKSKAKRKHSDCSNKSDHVGQDKTTDFHEEIEAQFEEIFGAKFDNQELTPERIIYRFLHDQYWSKRHKDKIDCIPDIISSKDFKQVSRITKSNPPILVVYSKKSVWELGLSDRAELGFKEQFSFLMRGPELFSDRERLNKIEFVLQDLIEFRQVMLLTHFERQMQVHTFFYFHFNIETSSLEISFLWLSGWTGTCNNCLSCLGRDRLSHSIFRSFTVLLPQFVSSTSFAEKREKVHFLHCSKQDRRAIFSC